MVASLLRANTCVWENQKKDKGKEEQWKYSAPLFWRTLISVSIQRHQSRCRVRLCTECVRSTSCAEVLQTRHYPVSPTQPHWRGKARECDRVTLGLLWEWLLFSNKLLWKFLKAKERENQNGIECTVQTQRARTAEGFNLSGKDVNTKNWCVSAGVKAELQPLTFRG